MIYQITKLKKFLMGIGDWGLGIGDWGLGPIPNPHSFFYLFINNNHIKYNISFQ